MVRPSLPIGLAGLQEHGASHAAGKKGDEASDRGGYVVVENALAEPEKRVRRKMGLAVVPTLGGVALTLHGEL